MDVEKTVIACASTVYGVDAADIGLNTDVREELSNQSIRLIAFVAALEDECGVVIEFQEAGALKTIGDFVDKIQGSL